MGERLHRVVQWVLRVGLAAAVLAMVLGLALAMHEGRLVAHPVPAGEIVGTIRDARPSGFMATGVLLLVATPAARVIALMIGFAAERDWRFVATALAVAAILVVGVFLGHA